MMILASLDDKLALIVKFNFMASELTQAIKQVCDEKRISVESVVETIELALGAAFRKDFGNKMQNIKVNFDMETGGFKVFDVKEVAEDELKAEYEKIKEERMKLAEAVAAGLAVAPAKKEEEAELEELAEGQAEVKKFNPKTMISLSEAREIKKTLNIGDELIQELLLPGDFGRMAAQTAKQVVIQKLREAERSTIFKEYQDKVGELLTGTVQRLEGRVVLVDFGNTTAVMPLEEGIRTENYQPGARFKFYVKNVEQSARGPRVIVSRAHPEILRKLFKLEVPEVASGAVQIKSIAREAGFRSKIAVFAKEENVDPIGSCVGQRGTRVQTIISELGGEKIDIIEWMNDPIKFIAKALSPAKVIRVELVETGDAGLRNQKIKKSKNQAGEDQEKSGGKTDARAGDAGEAHMREVKVYVASDQLSLAIGKEGQNVRLAAKLTGWKIDIMEDKLEDTENTEKVESPENTESIAAAAGQAASTPANSPSGLSPQVEGACLPARQGSPAGRKAQKHESTEGTIAEAVQAEDTKSTKIHKARKHKNTENAESSPMRDLPEGDAENAENIKTQKH
ncbi:transcription termination factor NusA [Candidatus Kuenenbacteria bacterium RIFCSPLOWO2_12_FULL_42_13]|uniref:Transcription termination/antitermination protein NusA n=1 Tax=Candidatus Kuenenbacteria bacterium RIFCSPLOWO2_12_FULL_42_13 TaxID=1798565 RepID=A0A1F6G1D7_9BACT|nr:MAG: transcription termination factor NusA [Candidatus Kuenenbacteria bacterium RIFCSPLOWO2_12_FULL_42_13]